MTPEQQELVKKITKMVLKEQLVWISCELDIGQEVLVELESVLENE